MAGNKDWNGKSANVNISWLNKDMNPVFVTVNFFENPHIENGISMSVANMSRNALGLCVKNYHPKLMTVPTLTTEKYNKIKNRVVKSKNPYQNKNIVLSHEEWVMKK
jgi:hypothetical protein